MTLTTGSTGIIVRIIVHGRLDTVGAHALQAELDARLTSDTLVVIIGLAQVNYLSSAGIRTFMKTIKLLSPKGGGLVVFGLQPYCREVLNIAGLDTALPSFDTQEEADRYSAQLVHAAVSHTQWDPPEAQQTEYGHYRFLPGAGHRASAKILGDIKDVLHARATVKGLCSKRFFETEYSLGLGALGDQPADYFPIMGEMMTVGGTMVWLPTDGNDTPDFLIPRADSNRIMIRTTFNVALAGGFNESIVFRSASPDGITVSALYRDLFTLARQRRPDFKGIIGLAIRAQMGSVYGSGIRKSPIADYAPADGKMITHVSHLAEWFDSDTEPRHRNVTGLIVGIGADLTADLSDYNEEWLNRVFYLHPANMGGKSELLHNHAVLFSPQPFPSQPTDLEPEIRAVIQDGDFKDMRHLLDTSTITEALIGIGYVQALELDTRGESLTPPDSPHTPAAHAAKAAVLTQLDPYRRLSGP